MPCIIVQYFSCPIIRNFILDLCRPNPNELQRRVSENNNPVTPEWGENVKAKQRRQTLTAELLAKGPPQGKTHFLDVPFTDFKQKRDQVQISIESLDGKSKKISVRVILPLYVVCYYFAWVSST